MASQFQSERLFQTSGFYVQFIQTIYKNVNYRNDNNNSKTIYEKFECHIAC
jgi:hypothetical protein